MHIFQCESANNGIHPAGRPVYVSRFDGPPTTADLIGFTKFNIGNGCRRFMFTRPAPDDHDYRDANGRKINGLMIMSDGAQAGRS